MIIFTEKSIHKWVFWRKKGKFVFCLSSGFLFSIFYSIAILTTKWALGREDFIYSALQNAFFMFFPMSFLSIALWYENERRYKKYLGKKSMDTEA